MAGPVTGLQPAADGFTLRLADGQVSLTRSVLITTGVSYRRLDAPGLDSLPGAGVFHGATASEAAAFAREHLFIAGGANSAGQAAVNQAHIMTGSGSHPLGNGARLASSEPGIYGPAGRPRWPAG